jgi:hypothetical protein
MQETVEPIEIPTRRELILKAARQLVSPGRLRRYLEFKFVYGNEYPYFDFADTFPVLARLVSGLAWPRPALDAPVFLAGLRRSGSTLFYRLLNAHSRLFLFNERFPGDRMNGRGIASKRNLLYSSGDPVEFRRVARRYLNPWLRARYTRWGAKLALELAHPHPGSVSAQAMEKILMAFPRARALLIVRDPRDFVLSALDRGGRDTEWWIEEYLAMTELYACLRRRYRSSVVIVRYEDLVTGPERMIRRCCEFLDLPYERAMLDPAHWSIKGPPEYQSGSIEAKLDKWRSADGGRSVVVRRVSERCFPAASRFGYRRAEIQRPVGPGGVGD